MKKLIVFLILCSALSLHSTTSMMHIFDEMDQHMHEMHEQMERVFMQMSEHSHMTTLQARDYSLSLQEKDDSVTIELSLPKGVLSSDVSVEMEDNALDVLVQSEGERVELKISGTYVTMNSSKTVHQEAKNNKGNAQTFSSGSSYMAQTIPLPTRIDLQRRAPQADLTEGLLTLTVAKKGAQKIPVTSSVHSIPVAQTIVQAPTSQEEVIDFEK